MTRAAAIAAVLGEVQERWGSNSLTRGYNGARESGLLASRTVRTAAPALPPWWPGAEGYLRPNILELRGPPSCGKLGLSLLWLAAADRGGLTAVVDLARTFYPPAAAASGLDLERLVVIRPPDRRGAAEAVSLLLTSAGFDAVLWPLEWRTRPSGLDAARLATLAARSATTLLALVTDRRRAARSNAATADRHGGAESVSGGAISEDGSDAILPSADVRLSVIGWEWAWRDGELAGVCPRVRAERLRGAMAGQAWELRLERHASLPPGSAGFQPAPAIADEASTRAGAWERGVADGDTGSTPLGERPGGDVRLNARPGGCPQTDHLCLASAFPLGDGGARATGPAGATDRGVRPDAAPAPATRTA
jgi:hypothetical protein